MSKQTQKEAVFNAVQSAFQSTGATFTEGTDIANTITKEQRKIATQILVQGFNSGDIQLNKQFDTKKTSAYASGLLSNWLRKDTRLNGGTQYTPSKTGTTRTTDPQLKAMKSLLASGTVTDPADIAEIESYIATRQTEIKAAKKPSISVDFNALPASLRSKYTAEQPTN